MDTDAGNTRRDLIWGDSNESTGVDVLVPLKHPSRDIGNLVGNTFLESRNYRTIIINLRVICI